MTADGKVVSSGINDTLGKSPNLFSFAFDKRLDCNSLTPINLVYERFYELVSDRIKKDRALSVLMNLSKLLIQKRIKGLESNTDARGSVDYSSTPST